MMQKLAGSEDLRIRRTRKLLEQALIEGTIEKGFAALTVRDITRRAMVNRSTFYRHYLDKYDLLEQHINAIYEGLEKEGRHIGEGRHEGLIELFKQLQQFSNFYRLVLGKDSDTFLSQRFRQQKQQRCRAHFQQIFPQAAAGPDTAPLDLKFTTVTSAGSGALMWWLEQEHPSTPEQFDQWMQQLIRDMLVPTFKQKK